VGVTGCNTGTEYSLREMSVEVRIKLEYFQKYGNWSLEVQSDDKVKLTMRTIVNVKF